MSVIARAESFVVPYTERNDHDSTRWSCLVRVECTDGVVGWGEAATIMEPAARGAAAVVDAWVPELLGTLAVPRVLGETLDRVSWWYGDAGIARFARSALDLALWDLHLTSCQVSLAEALSVDDQTIPALLSLHATRAELGPMAEEIAEWTSAIDAVGAKVAYGKRGDAGLGVDHDRDVSFLALLRRSLGDDARIMIDVAATLRWTPDEAIRRIRAFEQYDVAWTEEPLGADDPEGYRILRAAVTSPIAYGEREWGPRGYERIAATGTLNVAGVDPGRVGGVTGFLETTAILERMGIQGNAHAFAGPILLAAAIPLSLASPVYHQLEVPPRRNSLYGLADGPAPHRGEFSAPTAPGIGAVVDEAGVRAAAR